MKSSIPLLVLIFVGICMIPAKSLAQDWQSINPDGTEILGDTELIRSVIVTISPGETIGPVTHPTHFAYILTDGTLRVQYDGNDPQIMELKEGMGLHMDPEGPHQTENVGDEPFSFLIVELKEHPYE